MRPAEVNPGWGIICVVCGREEVGGFVLLSRVGQVLCDFKSSQGLEVTHEPIPGGRG